MTAGTPTPKADRQSFRRALRLMVILQGHVLDGLRLTQVAGALKTSLASALKDLEVAAEEGFTERIPGRDEYWRLTPRIVQISRATGEEFARVLARIDEFEQRYSRDLK